MAPNTNTLKNLFAKIKGAPIWNSAPVNFIKDNAVPIAAGAGGLVAGLGAAGIGSAIANNANMREMQANVGYVGQNMAEPYVMSNYGINPNVPSDIAQLPPEVFKQLILDPRHGGMYNPMTGEMLFA